MFIKFGFQRDYGAVKVDIGQDEVDLARILAERGIPVDAQLTPTEAFQVLRFSTEQLYLRELAHIVPAESEKAKLEYRNLQPAFDAEIGKIKVRLGIA